jgi:hypothetical protein
MSYQQACENSATLSHLGHLDLDGRRHIVGLWTTNAHVVVSDRADEIDGVQPSSSRAVDHLTLTWKTLTIGGGRYANISTSWELGKKDNALVFAVATDHPYDSSIREASDMTVVLYSSRDKRGWLLDGANALVYLARARLTSIMTEEKHQETLDQVRSNSGHNESALEVLQRLRRVKLFELFDSRYEMTSVLTPPSSGSTGASVDSGYASGTLKHQDSHMAEHKDVTTAWTYEKLVLDLWQNLLLMKASLDRLRRNPPHFDVRKPGLILTGWDAKDIIRRRQVQEPRYVSMDSGSKRWIRYTQAISSVVLMARDFGEVIVPDGNVPVCTNMQRLPTGSYLLAVPLRVLRQTAERYLLDACEHSRRSVQIHDSTFLDTYDTLTRTCLCKSGELCQPISKIRRYAKLDLEVNEQPSTLNIFDEHPNAAVIIGKPNFHERRVETNSTVMTQTLHRFRQMLFASGGPLVENLRYSQGSNIALSSDLQSGVGTDRACMSPNTIRMPESNVDKRKAVSGEICPDGETNVNEYETSIAGCVVLDQGRSDTGEETISISDDDSVESGLEYFSCEEGS